MSMGRGGPSGTSGTQTISFTLVVDGADKISSSKGEDITEGPWSLNVSCGADYNDYAKNAGGIGVLSEAGHAGVSIDAKSFEGLAHLVYAGRLPERIEIDARGIGFGTSDTVAFSASANSRAAAVVTSASFHANVESSVATQAMSIEIADAKRDLARLKASAYVIVALLAFVAARLAIAA
jgi:hypothetical protein